MKIIILGLLANEKTHVSNLISRILDDIRVKYIYHKAIE